MEYDERATDSRVKTAIQNLLGGMVLAAIPIAAVALLGLWNSHSTIRLEFDHLQAKIDRLQEFADRGDRYTSVMGREDKEESVARDLAEARARQDTDTELFRHVEKISQQIEDLKKYRADHRVESQEGFLRIKHMEKQYAELLKKIDERRHWPEK